MLAATSAPEAPEAGATAAPADAVGGAAAPGAAVPSAPPGGPAAAAPTLASAGQAPKPGTPPAKRARQAALVCVDPGHQRKANNELEPEGPGSDVMKAKVNGGTVGVFTKKPEYVLTLEVSLKLRDKLQELGYNVVMIRESNDVDISNRERSLLCNEAGADVAIRIHADGSSLPSVHGITVLYPSGGEMAEPSKGMAVVMLRELIAATGAKSRGVVPRNDLSGFNWSTIPSVLVEMGFMTNTEEDKRLSSDEYQDQLIAGMVGFVQKTFPL
ncbi:N-acetylmuramoyl-L-alanine amidase [Paenibacillus sp. HJGM_3]|uniref:N-acetylmuramoyl-L-alanine amidase n=1 Tax=Paenibacillus sp. HJGM_3 TaxID=3379816 RepID=UPI00385E7B17